MVHSEVYMNQYVASIAPFSTTACPDCSQNIQITAVFACVVNVWAKLPDEADFSSIVALRVVKSSQVKQPLINKDDIRTFNRNNEEKTIQCGGVIELNKLKQTSITKQCLIAWCKDSAAPIRKMNVN